MNIALNRHSFNILVERLSAILLLAILLWVFSSKLWLDIPIAHSLVVGDIIVVVLTGLLIYNIIRLAIPVATIFSAYTPKHARRLSIVTYRLLELASIGIAYLSLKHIGFKILVFFLAIRDAIVIYDSIFVVLAAVLTYLVIKAAVVG